MKGEKLTFKQKKFVKEFVKHGNGTKAALIAYDTKKETVASAIATENLEKPLIQKEILSIADRIPDDLCIEKHLSLLNAQKIKRRFIKGDLVDESEEEDTGAISKGLDMAYKLKKLYSDGASVNVNLNFSLKRLAEESEGAIGQT